jgi:hypothetical protein
MGRSSTRDLLPEGSAQMRNTILIYMGLLAACVLIAAVAVRRRTGRGFPARVWLLLLLSAIMGVATLYFLDAET